MKITLEAREADVILDILNQILKDNWMIEGQREVIGNLFNAILENLK